MTSWLPRWFALLVLMLLFVPTADARDNTEIARLIKQLGDNDFEKRESATARLKEIGEPALDVLHKAMTSNDPEVRRRAEELVAGIERKLSEEQMRLSGHTEAVYRVCVSADGKRLLTSSADKTLRLWDTDTGRCLRVFTGHTDCIIGAALSPDGQRVLSGSHDGTVCLWDATTGQELQKMPGPTNGVLSVAFGPDGQAVSGSFDATMRLWDLNTGKKLRNFTGHTGWMLNVTYSEQAKLAATSCIGTDRSIRLCHLETGKAVIKMIGHTDKIVSVCFSTDGKRLLSSSYDATVRLWDVQTGEELKQLKIHKEGVVVPRFRRMANASLSAGKTTP